MIELVSKNTKLLFETFQADHAGLARDLFDLRISLSEGQQEEIRAKAKNILVTAGAHIAFEEFNFYPILKPILEKGEVNRMYLEHAEGLKVINRLANCDDANFDDSDFLSEAIASLEVLEHHVADCGNLFLAVSSLGDSQSHDLLKLLNAWRKKAPAWTEIEALSKNEAC